MFTRISERMAGAGLLCLALAACDGGEAAAVREPGKVGGMADCAIGGQADWSRSCPVEQNGDLLTFRHEDGGFRRFRIVQDGRGLAAADGAEPVAVRIAGQGQVELSVGTDRYRVPATIASPAR